MEKAQAAPQPTANTTTVPASIPNGDAKLVTDWMDRLTELAQSVKRRSLSVEAQGRICNLLTKLVKETRKHQLVKLQNFVPSVVKELAGFNYLDEDASDLLWRLHDPKPAVLALGTYGAAR